MRVSLGRCVVFIGWLVAACLGSMAPAAAPLSAATLGHTVRSYKGQFVVSAPTLEMASALAKAAEDDKAKLEELLGVDLAWRTPAFVVITEEDIVIEDEVETMYSIAATREGRAERQGGVFSNRVEAAVRRATVVLALYGLADRGARAHGRSRCRREIPLWLVTGVEQNMSAGEREAFRGAMRDLIKVGAHRPLRTLFEQRGPVRSEEAREVFAIESGSVVDFLLSVEGGRERLVDAVANLWSKSDFALSLRWAFRDRFASPDAMEKVWVRFAIERPERTVGGERLTLAETRRRLDAILAVEIAVVEPDTVRESVERTDLRGLFNLDNAALRWKISRDKTVALTNLLLRSKEEYKPVIEKYVEAVRAVVAQDRGLFRLRYRQAQRLRTQVERLPYFVEDEVSSDASARDE